MLVSGAAGGVGSVAVAVLAQLGYRVVPPSPAVAAESEYPQAPGRHARSLDRAPFAAAGKPLAKERWAGAIDVVGGHTLANICASMRYWGVVAACGLAGGLDFPATVAPFILRGITLAGVESVMCPRAHRLEAWHRLSEDLDAGKLGLITEEIGLSQAIDHAAGLLDGRVRGRVVVDTTR
jgi:acrylyl-CoA reductase (NADPH)